jgi:hypothetical protein
VSSPRPVPEWLRPDQHEWCDRCERCANCLLDLQAMHNGLGPLECLGAGRSQRHRCADHPAFAALLALLGLKE